MLGFVKVDRKERFLFSDSLLRVTLFFSEKCGPCVAPRAISNCFGRVFYFFLSLVNKYCLTHSFWWFLGSKKKKKSIRECADYILWEMSPFLPQQSPTDVQLFRGLQTDQLNLINIQVKITFLGLCYNIHHWYWFSKMFSRRQLEILNPQEHCWKTFNLTSFTCTPILFTDCMKMSYYSVLKIDVESSNIPWVKNIFFYRPFLLITFQF